MNMFGLEMAGYGNLTNASMAYLPYWNYLPMAATNFGGDIQIFPVDPYQPTQVGLAFNNIAQQYWGIPGIFGGYQMSPSINPASVIYQASQMSATTLNQMGSQAINESLQAISGQKTKLQALLNDKNTKAEDKAKIQEKIKQLEEYEKQLNDLKTSGMDPLSAYKKATEIRSNVNKAITGQNTSSQPAQSGSAASSTNNNGTTNTGSASGSSGTSGTTGAAGAGAADNHDPNYTSYTDIIDDLHDSMFRPGTDDPTLEAAMDKINKDNIIDIMIQWNQAYPEESLMEAFMADADKDQKFKYGKQLRNALRDKATELGIDLTHDADYKKICKEMNSWFWIDNGVADNYNALIKKIAAKEGKKFDYTPYSMLPKK